MNNIQKSNIDELINDVRIKYKTIEKCPICNHERFLLIAEKDRYGIPLDTMVCEKCGLVFSLNQMTTDGSIIPNIIVKYMKELKT